MSKATTIATWDVLREFGFQPDKEVVSEGGRGLSFDFGNFTLSADCGLGAGMVDTVLFGGILPTARTRSLVQFEMPIHVESREQCAAWIVWHLDQHSGRNGFLPKEPTPWLEVGREYQDRLPWEQQRRLREAKAELYCARPHCLVPRQWMRLALNSMAKHLEKSEDNDIVCIAFRDGVLTFQLVNERVIVAGKGDSWTTDYVIPAGRLRNLPKRLMDDPVVVGIWESQLEIDRHRYAGLNERQHSNHSMR